MPSAERDESRDRELVLKHHPSISDSGRSIPMYVELYFACSLSAAGDTALFRPCTQVDETDNLAVET